MIRGRALAGRLFLTALLACLGLLLALSAYAAMLWFTAARVPDIPLRRGELATATLIERYAHQDGHIEQIALRSSSGIAFEIALRIPDQPLPGRPLVVLLAGNETGHRAATMIRDPGGIAVAALSYPFREIPYREFWSMLRALPDIQRGILDTPSAVLLALDYLAGRDDLAPAHIELAGVSFGAYLAPAAAAFAPQLDRLWLIHGSVDPRAVLHFGLAERLPWPTLAGPLAGYLAQVAGAAHLAPEHWLGRLGALPLVAVSARADESLPAAAVRALHAQLPPGTPVLWTPGDHVHPKRPEIMDLLSRMLRERIEAALVESRAD
jgi:hypothetical protein